MPSADSFVHLHVHTEYSMLDGAARIGELFKAAEKMGMPALATTDHGYVFGAYEFWKTAQKYDVNPIIGIEGYVTPQTHRSERRRVKWGDASNNSSDDVSGGGSYTHMTLLAQNTTGMHNLFRMASLASLEGYYFKPRVDRELLQTYGKGLIATTGCPGGEVQTRLRLGQYKQAVEAAAEFRDIFGAENYYCELMDHGLDVERKVQKDLLRLAKDLDLPLVATNDLHYTNAEDAPAHAALLCVQSASTLSDPNRFKFESDEYYLKTPAQMRDLGLFREYPEACDNTLLIAERCDVTFTEGEGRYMPRFPCPEGENEESWFVKEVETGLHQRYPQGIPGQVRKQAEYEIDVITEKGYCFPPETPVLMADGSWKPISEVSEGDEVTSVSTWDYRSRTATVEEVLSRTVDEDLCVIRPYGQPFPIRATDEHPFFVATRGWVDAKDVRPGDYVLAPQPVSEPYQPYDLEALTEARGWLVERDDHGLLVRLGASELRAPRPTKGAMPAKVEWSADLMWILGLWVAEGHLYDPDASSNPGQIGWTLHKDEPAVRRLCEVIDRLGLGSPRIYRKASAASPGHKGVVVMLTNHPLALFLLEMFGAGVRDKTIHLWIQSVPEEGLRAFISGWHEGDGHTKDSGRVVITTVNATLARHLRSMLLSMGQWASIMRSPSQRAYGVAWTPGSTRAPYNARCVDGRWWVRVRAVGRERYTGSVHNLTVSGDHTYVAGGVAVHNCGYFLVVADFINWAKRQGIRVGPGRGSGAGAITAYAMGITDLDPLQHGLIFERFLNPERMSMPDFDVDFDDRRRPEVIRYVTEKYGDDRVAMIVTYGTIKAKQAIKDAGRVLDYPFAMGDRITKAMPPTVMGKDIPLSGIFDPEHKRYSEATEFRQLYESDQDVRKIVDTARGLENLKRQWGVHAAGVIMSSEPLIDLIPIMRREQDGQIITQLDYPSCETLGLVKMDFLGLRNLTILDDSLRHIETNHDIAIDLDELSKSLDDKPTYELLSRGDTLGVFQFDGGPMRALLRLMKPDSFEDISAVGALYRPGPMGANSHTNYALRKNGQQEISYLHPELEEALKPILGPTYGLIVYQEQVLQIAQQLAGYSLGKADLLRKAMGKKKKEVLDAEYVGFEAGMRERGFSPAAIKVLWDVLVPFSDYAFNKAHSAAYGLVSYWTAYLKANYPAEYMAAVLTSVADDKDKMAVYLNECRRMGINVLPPDVNESASDFTPIGNDIRFGLSAIRNVGVNVVAEIVEARKTKGRFTDFTDFVDKVSLPVCNKRVIESLAKAGAFDSMRHARRAVVAVHEQAVDEAIDLKRNEAIGQFDLFSMGEESPDQGSGRLTVVVPEIDEWDKQTKLTHERDMLGLYVSDHPLFGVEHVLSTGADCTIGQLLADEERPDGTLVTIGGLITSVQRKVNKRGDIYAIVTVEDLEGSIEVMMFSSSYQLAAHLLVNDAIVLIKGRLRRRDDRVELSGSDVIVPDLADAATGPVVISMPVNRCTPPLVEQLRDVLKTHPGMTEVQLKLQASQRTTRMRLGDGFRVTPTPALMADLKALLGPSCLAG